MFSGYLGSRFCWKSHYNYKRLKCRLLAMHPYQQVLASLLTNAFPSRCYWIYCKYLRPSPGLQFVLMCFYYRTHTYILVLRFATVKMLGLQRQKQFYTIVLFVVLWSMYLLCSVLPTQARKGNVYVNVSLTLESCGRRNQKHTALMK